MSRMNRNLFLPGLIVLALCLPPRSGATYDRSWNFLTTGNGHGFQVFNRQEHRVQYFLEQPYRYLAPGDAARTWGVGRRDLAHDVYFGLRANGQSTWLHDQAEVEYEARTNIIHAWSNHSGLRADTYYFAPFGLEANAMVMLIKLTNSGGGAVNATVFAKPNLKLGSGRIDPGEEGEQISWTQDGELQVVTETGPGGGHALYLPIGGADHSSCGSDGDLYNAVKNGAGIGDAHSCSGSGRVNVFQKDLDLPAGGSAWWGMVVLFVNDNPSDAAAGQFKDTRTPADVLALWRAFAGSRTADQVHADALAEWDAWRTHREPTGLTDVEHKLWEQSETILRMAQIREERTAIRRNHGMILASLPVGEWHTGWLRDGTYAIASLAMLGHTEEAEAGLEFYLGADSGFFKQANYLKYPYRTSVCRYFGDGLEEGDFNTDGPNIETDGWGLVLWAARHILHFTCDVGWLDRPTWKGDTVYQALKDVATDIEDHIQGDLPEADASIWEVHWNRRQVFTYTAAAQCRGLYDFAAIADYYGQTADAQHFRALADKMLAAIQAKLVYADTNSLVSHKGVVGDEAHVDGSTVEAFSWDLIPPGSAIFKGTVQEYSRLLTTFGGYRRLEEELSLTGGGGANEYDLSEWILLDLRISEAWRRGGDAEKAEKQLLKVTESAAKNDFQIPELFEPTTGAYAGVVPMVGYGAGAWIMTQIHKHQAPDPSPGSSLEHCRPTQPEELPEGAELDPDAVQPAEAFEFVVPGYDTIPYDSQTPVKDATVPDTMDGAVGLNDGAATLCSACDWRARVGAAPVLLMLGLTLAGLMLIRRRRPGARPWLGLLLLGLTPPLLAGENASAVPATSQGGVVSSEAAESQSQTDWEVDFHGYTRMPLRWNGTPWAPRSPFLVDDDYYKSGFQYLRVAESEWAEVFLGVHKRRTRAEVGLFSSQFSDWSESTLTGQWGIATAALEQGWSPGRELDLTVKAGMFWDRMGYLEPYDTYVFGRTHQAGVVVRLAWRERFFLKIGYGAHAERIKDNEGFTPLAYAVMGGGWGPLDGSLYVLKAWMRTSTGMDSLVQDGDLLVLGADLRVRIPWTGPIYLAIARYKAESVAFLANAFEVLHSTGGGGLTDNFFGSNSQNGTGEILVTALDYPARVWDGVSVRLFGMTAWVLSKQQSDDPLQNRHDRLYLKWGLEPRYRFPRPVEWLYAALRYDRVILDTAHEAMSFRVFTPSLGVTPVPGAALFVAWSHYSYGSAVKLRSNAYSLTDPDTNTFRVQAQITW
jgi:hypothetical protein